MRSIIMIERWYIISDMPSVRCVTYHDDTVLSHGRFLACTPDWSTYALCFAFAEMCQT